MFVCFYEYRHVIKTGTFLRHVVTKKKKRKWKKEGGGGWEEEKKMYTFK